MWNALHARTRWRMCIRSIQMDSVTSDTTCGILFLDFNSSEISCILLLPFCSWCGAMVWRLLSAASCTHALPVFACDEQHEPEMIDPNVRMKRHNENEMRFCFRCGRFPKKDLSNASPFTCGSESRLQRLLFHSLSIHSVLRSPFSVVLPENRLCLLQKFILIVVCLAAAADLCTPRTHCAMAMHRRVGEHRSKNAELQGANARKQQSSVGMCCHARCKRCCDHARNTQNFRRKRLETFYFPDSDGICEQKISRFARFHIRWTLSSTVRECVLADAQNNYELQMQMNCESRCWSKSM